MIFRHCKGCLSLAGLREAFGPPAHVYRVVHYLVLVWNKNLLRGPFISDPPVSWDILAGSDRGLGVGQLVQSEDAVLSAFVKDGRITTMPAKRLKRLALLDHVAGHFDVGVHYTELEVNVILRGMFDDYVALRRYLVDEGFLDRSGGEYWRSGGTVDLG